MNDAINQSLKNNPAIKAANFNLKSFIYEEKAAGSLRLPKIDFQEKAARTTNPMWAFGTKLNQERITISDFNPLSLNNPDAINNFSSVLSLIIPIYAGGKIINGLKIAEFGKKAAILNLEQVKENTIKNTIKTYLKLLLVKKNLEVLHLAINSAKANLKLVQSRYGSGFSVKSDLLRAKVRLSTLEQKKFKARGCIKIARAYFNAAMGLPINTFSDAVETLEIIQPVKNKVDVFINMAINNRNEIKIMKIQEAIAQKAINMAKADHLPMINAFGNYEMDSENFGSHGSNYTIGALISFNIFNGNKINSQIHSARAKLMRIKELTNATELKVRVDVREAYCHGISAWESIKVAKTTIHQAEESLRIIKNRYENGLVTMVSLLDGDLALEEARTNYYKSVYDYRVALTDLKWASGIILNHQKQ